jgi:transposase
MSQVIIGMDPHKRPATIEVMTAGETVTGGGRYGADAAGLAAMLAAVRRWPERTWAVEGSRGTGRQLASWLVAAGERVVDVPPELSARTRVFTAGQGRKTDATDAHAIALAATRSKGLHPVADDAQLEVLRVLAGRRRALGEDHTRMICQLHQLLAGLIPGGAKKSLSAAQARALLARVRPRDPAGQARRRVAAELTGDLQRTCQRKKAAGKELAAAVKATGTTLMTLDGIGPSGAARLLVEVAGITRFPDRGHFASWNGTAPIDASSGDHVRHRLSRAGNRQINRVLHIMAVVQPRHQGPRLLRPQGRRRENPDGSDARPQTPPVRRGVPADGGRRPRRPDGPGRTPGGRLLAPARPAHTPMPALRISHFPDPLPATLRRKAIPFPRILPPPLSGAGPQPPSSALCLTAGRTGAR